MKARTLPAEARVMPRDPGHPPASFEALDSHSNAPFVADDRGASFVEYVILVGLVAIVAMAGFKTFGFQVRSKIDQQAVTVSAVPD